MDYTEDGDLLCDWLVFHMCTLTYVESVIKFIKSYVCVITSENARRLSCSSINNRIDLPMRVPRNHMRVDQY